MHANPNSPDRMEQMLAEIDARLARLEADHPDMDSLQGMGDRIRDAARASAPKRVTVDGVEYEKKADGTLVPVVGAADAVSTPAGGASPMAKALFASGTITGAPAVSEPVPGPTQPVRPAAVAATLVTANGEQTTITEDELAILQRIRTALQAQQ